MKATSDLPCHRGGTRWYFRYFSATCPKGMRPATSCGGAPSRDTIGSLPKKKTADPRPRTGVRFIQGSLHAKQGLGATTWNGARELGGKGASVNRRTGEPGNRRQGRQGEERPARGPDAKTLDSRVRGWGKETPAKPGAIPPSQRTSAQRKWGSGAECRGLGEVPSS